MSTSGLRAWQVDWHSCTSTAAAYHRVVAAKRADERSAAAVSCTSALGDALLLTPSAARASAVLLQRRQ